MLSKLVRIGKDAELRRTSEGKAVIGLACVYDIGWGDKKRGQWIEVSIWGKQAEALQPYLLKGKQVVIHADDVELEIFQKNDGTQGSKLKARAVNVELAGSKQDSATQGAIAPQQQPQQPQQMQQQPQQAPQQQPQQGYQQPQQAPQAQPMNNNFDDDDIPF